MRDKGETSVSSEMSALEIMLLTVQSALACSDRVAAAKAAKKASPYAGMTVDQIIDALESGLTVPEILAEVDRKLWHGRKSERSTR